MYNYDMAIRNICFETHHCRHWDERSFKCRLGRKDINEFGLAPLTRGLFNWMVGCCRFGSLYLCVKETAQFCLRYEKVFK